jgi:hypothetical protein
VVEKNSMLIFDSVETGYREVISANFTKISPVFRKQVKDKRLITEPGNMEEMENVTFITKIGDKIP